MKTSDTANSFATTGLGSRLDIEPDQWFMAKVTAVAVDGAGFNIYTLVEVRPIDRAYGYETKPHGITANAVQEVNNAEVAVDTIVLARKRGLKGTVPTFEFWVGGVGNVDDESKKIVDHVHVVGNGGSGDITCRSVAISDPAAWPPVEASPVIEYEGVWESEDREPRIVDSPGTATHIIPLFKAPPHRVNQVEQIDFNFASTGGNLQLTVEKTDGTFVTTANIAWSSNDATYLAAINSALDAATGVVGGIVASAIPSVDTDLGFLLTYSGVGYTGLPWTPAVVALFPTTSTSAVYTPITAGSTGIGKHYIVFWKTCTFDDLTLMTDVNITSIVQNADCSFTVVMSKTYETRRWFVDVNPPGNPESGLRLRIDTQANLPDVCDTGVGQSIGLLLALTRSPHPESGSPMGLLLALTSTF